MLNTLTQEKGRKVMFQRINQLVAESDPFIILPIVHPHTLAADILRSLLDCSVPFTDFKPLPFELQIKFRLGPTHLPPICPRFYSSHIFSLAHDSPNFSSLTLFEENLSWLNLS